MRIVFRVYRKVLLTWSFRFENNTFSFVLHVSPYKTTPSIILLCVKQIGEKINEMAKDEEKFHQFAKLARVLDGIFFCGSLFATVV